RRGDDDLTKRLRLQSVRSAFLPLSRNPSWALTVAYPDDLTKELSMVLIKVADISNEARPMEVAEPWLDNLLQEFFQQSDAEKLSGLPVTPFMDREKVTKPSSQCGFIGLVLLPLFSTLCELFPELLVRLV
ncbi:hypothetical protein TKK_0017259, partial [Trichogramma kaykai]